MSAQRPSPDLGPASETTPLSAVDVIGRAIIEPRRPPVPGDPVALVQEVLWETLLNPPPR